MFITNNENDQSLPLRQLGLGFDVLIGRVDGCSKKKNYREQYINMCGCTPFFNSHKPVDMHIDSK